MQTEYWCHNCQKTVICTPDVLCMQCSSPFIEEVHYEQHISVPAILQDTDLMELTERLRVLYAMLRDMRGLQLGDEETESMRDEEVEAIRIVDRLEERCGICLQEHQDTIRSLPCSHTFHETCLRKWLKMKGICPICKQSARGNRQI